MHKWHVATTLTGYYGNLWHYNIDRMITNIRYPNRRKSTVSVPFMITARMTKQLRGLGYTPNQINQLDPKDANEIISKGQSSKPVPLHQATKNIIKHENVSCNKTTDSFIVGDSNRDTKLKDIVEEKKTPMLSSLIAL